ncbi:Hypothetical predicted protein [Podarcis lilfordi]|uniref:Uncharacterized protein n=1 Tax=Podarcis lilfordi TaxID=74358 RepID=A0AA35P8J8_9SAUR|nr:Hypothetical predicted protein [Podarcis lilfordi]
MAAAGRSDERTDKRKSHSHIISKLRFLERFHSCISFARTNYSLDTLMQDPRMSVCPCRHGSYGSKRNVWPSSSALAGLKQLHTLPHTLRLTNPLPLTSQQTSLTTLREGQETIQVSSLKNSVAAVDVCERKGEVFSHSFSFHQQKHSDIRRIIYYVDACINRGQYSKTVRDATFGGKELTFPSRWRSTVDDFFPGSLVTNLCSPGLWHLLLRMQSRQLLTLMAARPTDNNMTQLHRVQNLILETIQPFQPTSFKRSSTKAGSTARSCFLFQHLQHEESIQSCMLKAAIVYQNQKSEEQNERH